MIFIEPLLQKLKVSIRGKVFDSLDKSISLYGEQSDIDLLVKLIEQNLKKGTCPIIDFTPFSTLGTQTRLSRLVELAEVAPFIILIKKRIVLEYLRTLGKISAIVVDDNFQIVEESYVGKKARSIQNQCKEIFKKGENAYTIHQRWVSDCLEKEIDNVLGNAPLGKRYYKLTDDTWANTWIDIKVILSKPEQSFFIAYQIGYSLTKGYGINLGEDFILSSNNSSYVVATLLSCIFNNKNLIMLDRVGTFPRLSQTTLLDATKLEGKKCVMVEDVLGTGREADLVTLLLFLSKAQVTRVACIYDLEIASPMLFPAANIVSLCKPANYVAYKRRPKYAVENEK